MPKHPEQPTKPTNNDALATPDTAQPASPPALGGTAEAPSPVSRRACVIPGPGQSPVCGELVDLDGAPVGRGAGVGGDAERDR